MRDATCLRAGHLSLWQKAEGRLVNSYPQRNSSYPRGHQGPAIFSHAVPSIRKILPSPLLPPFPLLGKPFSCPHAQFRSLPRTSPHCPGGIGHALLWVLRYRIYRNLSLRLVNFLICMSNSFRWTPVLKGQRPWFAVRFLSPCPNVCCKIGTWQMLDSWEAHTDPHSYLDSQKNKL